MSTPLPRSLALISTVAAATLLAGCGGSSGSGDDGKTAEKTESAASTGSAAAKIPVVASTNVWGDIAQQVGGDKVTVTSIITNPDQDPHSFEASTRNQLTLSKARLVIENGGGYDDFVSRMTKSNPSAAKIDAVEVSGHEAPAGGELNEHVWYDFPSVEKVADRIAEELGKVSPEDAATFEKNAETFTAKLEPLTAKEAGIKKNHAGDGVAITEPVPLYMTEAAGLENKTPEEFSEAIEEGDDVSPQVLRTTLGLFSSHQVKVLVYNEQTAGAQTQKVLDAAKKAGVPVVPVTETLPAGKDYLSWMTANVDALADALDK
ncbi:metal ABC transporter solute-binding protein, Zn/Mn family [Streptomyces sp. BBFR115]|uniref:metal ABC transporter solute-binding protein, Zn/Mn family n=1 Tax=Streptomyces sp. BBFR115 TaxID=3448173 RepID=UPI003F75E7F9